MCVYYYGALHPTNSSTIRSPSPHFTSAMETSQLPLQILLKLLRSTQIRPCCIQAKPRADSRDCSKVRVDDRHIIFCPPSQGHTEYGTCCQRDMLHLLANLAPYPRLKHHTSMPGRWKHDPKHKGNNSVFRTVSELEYALRRIHLENIRAEWPLASSGVLPCQESKSRTPYGAILLPRESRPHCGCDCVETSTAANPMVGGTYYVVLTTTTLWICSRRGASSHPPAALRFGSRHDLISISLCRNNR